MAKVGDKINYYKTIPKKDNTRICRSCGKLIHSHSEQQLKACDKKQDKYRQVVGRIAFSQCIKVNPDNPQAVAESINDMYEALQEILKAYDKLEGVQPYEIAHAIGGLGRQALTKAEGLSSNESTSSR